MIAGLALATARPGRAQDSEPGGAAGRRGVLSAGEEPLVELAPSVRVVPPGDTERANAETGDPGNGEAGHAEGSPCKPYAQGCFRETDGAWRSASDAYRLMQADRDPDYLQTSIELVLGLAAGTAWYWIEKDENKKDWDYDSWLKRFDKDAFRYDNNGFPINFAWHAWSGAGYYFIGRANELGFPAAAAGSFLTSWLWEWVIEFRERISINDQIFTPGTGIALGEFFHRLGQYLNSAPGGGGIGHRVAAWTAGLPTAVHDVIDREGAPPADTPSDEHGFGTDIAARFRASYGVGVADPFRNDEFVLHEMAFRGRLVAIPGYLRPGSFGQVFADANVTQLRFRGTAAVPGGGLELAADTMLVGWHGQSLEGADALARKHGLEGEHGALYGGATTIGTSVSLFYRRNDYGAFRDRLAVFGWPGLALDSHAFFGVGSLRFGVRLQGDFAGVHAQAFDDWQDQHPDEQPKTILDRHQYYYGWGGSGRAFFELRLPYLQLGARARYGIWSSHEGLDRKQAQVTADVRASDRALDYETWLRVVPFEFGVFFEASHASQRRWSGVGGFRASQRLDRYQVAVGVVR